jgi:hypothetical protein
MPASQRCSSGALVATTKNGSPTVSASSPSSCGTGLCPGDGTKPSGTAIGSTSSGSATTAMCSAAWRRIASRRVATCAYRYAASSASWKKSSDVFQTAGVLPNCGSTNFANIGWMRNTSAALTNSVSANSDTTAVGRARSRRRAGARGAGARTVMPGGL